MDQNWKDILVLRAAADEWYQQCLQKVKDCETDYLELKAALSPAGQEALDRYIAVCEELEHALVQLAYRLGKEG